MNLLLAAQVFLIFISTAFANETFYLGFHDNPLLHDRLKVAIAPHLLPLDHPLKVILDLIFSQSRVTESTQSIQDAGFSILHSMPRSFVVVARHPAAPGYIFKMHLDSEKKGRHGASATDWLIHRCISVKNIKQIIEKKQIRHFTVPDKWLYVLPVFPPSKESNPKPIILIATDMNIASDEESKQAWKTVITKEHLKELYQILKAGYGSVSLSSNVPYKGDGIFAIVDTEKRVPRNRLKRVSSYLSPPMKKYWDHLID